MDSTTRGPSPAREKPAAIRHVAPARAPLVRPPAPPARSPGWAFLVLLAWLFGLASLAGGLYVYFF